MPTINFNDINQLFPNLQVDNNVINFYSEIVCQEADLQLNNIFADPILIRKIHFVKKKIYFVCYVKCLHILHGQ